MRVQPFPPPKRFSAWPLRGRISTRTPAHLPRCSRRRRAAHNLRSRPCSAPRIRPGVSWRLFSAVAQGPGPMPLPLQRPFSPGSRGRLRPSNAGSTHRRRLRLCLRLSHRRPSAHPPRRARVRSAALPKSRKWFRPTSRHPRTTLVTTCPNRADRPFSARFHLSQGMRCRLPDARKRLRRPTARQSLWRRPSAQRLPRLLLRNGRRGLRPRPPDCSAVQPRPPRDRRSCRRLEHARQRKWTKALNRQPRLNVRPPMRGVNRPNAPSMRRLSVRHRVRRRQSSASPRARRACLQPPEIVRGHRTHQRSEGRCRRRRRGKRSNCLIPRLRHPAFRFSLKRRRRRAVICPLRGLGGRNHLPPMSSNARRPPV